MADLSEKVIDDGENCHISRQTAKKPAARKGGPPSPVQRLIAWLTPYTMRQYPGKYAFWHIATPGYAPMTVKHWLLGSNPVPPKILRQWAGLARAQASTGLAIAADLEAAAAELESRPRHDPSENLRRYRLKKRSTTTL